LAISLVYATALKRTVKNQYVWIRTGLIWFWALGNTVPYKVENSQLPSEEGLCSMERL
jgi:hypothetical protein